MTAIDVQALFISEITEEPAEFVRDLLAADASPNLLKSISFFELYSLVRSLRERQGTKEGVTLAYARARRRAAKLAVAEDTK